MMVASVSALLIYEVRLWGPRSPILALAVFTLVAVPLAVSQARRHAVESHRRSMIAIFVGGLVVAGGLTFLPGRIVHAVSFGG